MIAAYLLDPASGRYLLDEMSLRYLNRELPTAKVPEETDGQLGLLAPEDDGVNAAAVAGAQAAAVLPLADKLRSEEHTSELQSR